MAAGNSFFFAAFFFLVFAWDKNTSANFKTTSQYLSAFLSRSHNTAGSSPRCVILWAAADDTVRCCCSRAVSSATRMLCPDGVLFQTTCREVAAGFSSFCLHGGSSCDGKHHEHKAEEFSSAAHCAVPSGPDLCSCCKGIFSSYFLSNLWIRILAKKDYFFFFFKL